jgi:hypothetical protein
VLLGGVLGTCSCRSAHEKEVNQPKLIVTFGVYDSKGKLLDTFETNFEGPFKLQF